ncbi:MAG: hypothetical protein K8R36_05000, partial [Planctomycetales bacterium]|nr:hypothetical protein [Planctomycetales bacterium]
FSLRDLFLVTVIAAVLLAWWADKRSDTMERQKLKEEYFTNITNMSKEWGRDLGTFPSYPNASVLPNAQAFAPTPPKK